MPRIHAQNTAVCYCLFVAFSVGDAWLTLIMVYGKKYHHFNCNDNNIRKAGVNQQLCVVPRCFMTFYISSRLLNSLLA